MDDDAAFTADLYRSSRVVHRWAVTQYERGVQIYLPPERMRPDAEQRADYTDRGDGMIILPFEYKSRRIAFRCRDDYPYATVIIDEVRLLDRGAHLPLLYIIESADGEHVAVVYGWTRPHWRVETYFDKAKKRQRDFYTVPKSMVRFCHKADVLYADP